MEYKRFADAIVVRIDRGEEIVEQVKKIAEQEKITLASVEALGATDDFTVGTFNVDRQEYRANRFAGIHEIVSLIGTVGVMDGAPYLHLHMCAADETGKTFGGHLTCARVGVTCEMVIRPINGAVDRKKDPAIGVNLWQFPKI